MLLVLELDIKSSSRLWGQEHMSPPMTMSPNIQSKRSRTKSQCRTEIQITTRVRQRHQVLSTFQALHHRTAAHQRLIHHTLQVLIHQARSQLQLRTHQHRDRFHDRTPKLFMCQRQVPVGESTEITSRLLHQHTIQVVDHHPCHHQPRQLQQVRKRMK